MNEGFGHLIILYRIKNNFDIFKVLDSNLYIIRGNSSKMHRVLNCVFSLIQQSYAHPGQIVQWDFKISESHFQNEFHEQSTTTHKHSDRTRIVVQSVSNIGIGSVDAHAQSLLVIFFHWLSIHITLHSTIPNFCALFLVHDMCCVLQY